MRRKHFIWNTISSFISQIVGIICAFILPKLILESYGTEVNGLISSISQFLAVISLSEFGITAVVQSSLYKPLANKDYDEISKIMASATRFFRRIAYILLGYIFILCIFYPSVINSEFNNIYTISLIVILSINSFSQYLFGITNSQLITADKKGYIISITGIITTILNTIICYILIKLGFSIQIVKLATTLIFLIKPIVCFIYVKIHYQVDINIHYESEPIQQKWNGVAQHISYYVLNGTDVMILTLFSSLENVSIYTVYNLVLSGLKQMFSVFENVVRPLLGEYWALNQIKKLENYFSLYEWTMHTLTTLIYGCTLMLIVPFIQVYTSGIKDANYMVPFFAMTITLAFAIQNIRNPYNSLIMCVGHYKQTQGNYITVTIINIAISILTVYKFGLVGVAMGTLMALSFQTLWQARYTYRNILNWKFRLFLKQLAVDSLIFVIGFILTHNIKMGEVSYFGWVVLAIKIFFVWSMVILVINITFYKSKIISISKLMTQYKK